MIGKFPLGDRVLSVGKEYPLFIVFTLSEFPIFLVTNVIPAPSPFEEVISEIFGKNA